MDFEHPEQVLAYIRERDIPGINDRIELASMLRRGQIFAGVMDGRNIIGFIKIGWETVYVLDYGSTSRCVRGLFRHRYLYRR